MDFGILPFKTDPYISSTFFGEFQFALRDQSDQESEGAVPVSLRDKDLCVEVYTDHPHGAGAFWKEKPDHPDRALSPGFWSAISGFESRNLGLAVNT